MRNSNSLGLRLSGLKGYELRVTGYGLRVTSYGLRVTSLKPKSLRHCLCGGSAKRAAAQAGMSNC